MSKKSVWCLFFQHPQSKEIMNNLIKEGTKYVSLKKSRIKKKNYMNYAFSFTLHAIWNLQPIQQ